MFAATGSSSNNPLERTRADTINAKSLLHCAWRWTSAYTLPTAAVRRPECAESRLEWQCRTGVVFFAYSLYLPLELALSCSQVVVSNYNGAQYVILLRFIISVEIGLIIGSLSTLGACIPILIVCFCVCLCSLLYKFIKTAEGKPSTTYIIHQAPGQAPLQPASQLQYPAQGQFQAQASNPFQLSQPPPTSSNNVTVVPTPQLPPPPRYSQAATSQQAPLLPHYNHHHLGNRRPLPWAMHVVMHVHDVLVIMVEIDIMCTCGTAGITALN